MIKQNEGLIDRMLRGLLAAIFLVIGYYWFSGTKQIFFYVLGVLMVITAISGFCSFYRLFDVDTKKLMFKRKSLFFWILAILTISVLIGGAYASNFFTKKIFIDDFNAMNNNYKQILFNTGQNKRPESITYYEKLSSSFFAFQAKYNSYKPQVIRSDAEFNDDIEKIKQQIIAAGDKVYSGDLSDLHIELEIIRSEFQDILKRNNFSMLGIALSDFHDAMEIAVDAGEAKNAEAVIAAYPEADARLRIVEEAANDEDIQLIRKNLEALKLSAENNRLEDLVRQGADLKSSYIKVYLKRG